MMSPQEPEFSFGRNAPNPCRGLKGKFRLMLLKEQSSACLNGPAEVERQELLRRIVEEGLFSMKQKGRIKKLIKRGSSITDAVLEVLGPNWETECERMFRTPVHVHLTKTDKKTLCRLCKEGLSFKDALAIITADKPKNNQQSKPTSRASQKNCGGNSSRGGGHYQSTERVPCVSNFGQTSMSGYSAGPSATWNTNRPLSFGQSGTGGKICEQPSSSSCSPGNPDTSSLHTSAKESLYETPTSSFNPLPGTEDIDDPCHTYSAMLRHSECRYTLEELEQMAGNIPERLGSHARVNFIRQCYESGTDPANYNLNPDDEYGTFLSGLQRHPDCRHSFDEIKLLAEQIPRCLGVLTRKNFILRCYKYGMHPDSWDWDQYDLKVPPVISGNACPDNRGRYSGVYYTYTDNQIGLMSYELPTVRLRNKFMHKVRKGRNPKRLLLEMLTSLNGFPRSVLKKISDHLAKGQYQPSMSARARLSQSSASGRGLLSGELTHSCAPDRFHGSGELPPGLRRTFLLKREAPGIYGSVTPQSKINDINRVFIVPTDQPGLRFTDEQMDAVEVSILEAIYGLEEFNSDKPFFTESFRNNGRYSILCGDEFSMNWLHRHFDDHQPLPNITLEVVSPQSAKIAATVTLPNCRNDDDDRVLQLIENQNQGVNVGMWEVCRRWEDSQGTHMDLVIDKESARKFENCCEINFKFGSATIRIKECEPRKNSSPEVAGIPGDISASNCGFSLRQYEEVHSSGISHDDQRNQTGTSEPSRDQGSPEEDSLSYDGSHADQICNKETWHRSQDQESPAEDVGNAGSQNESHSRSANQQRSREWRSHGQDSRLTGRFQADPERTESSQRRSAEEPPRYGDSHDELHSRSENWQRSLKGRSPAEDWRSYGGLHAHQYHTTENQQWSRNKKHSAEHLHYEKSHDEQDSLEHWRRSRERRSPAEGVGYAGSCDEEQSSLQSWPSSQAGRSPSEDFRSSGRFQTDLHHTTGTCSRDQRFSAEDMRYGGSRDQLHLNTECQHRSRERSLAEERHSYGGSQAENHYTGETWQHSRDQRRSDEGVHWVHVGSHGEQYSRAGNWFGSREGRRPAENARLCDGSQLEPRCSTETRLLSRDQRGSAARSPLGPKFRAAQGSASYHDDISNRGYSFQENTRGRERSWKDQSSRASASSSRSPHGLGDFRACYPNTTYRSHGYRSASPNNGGSYSSDWGDAD